MAYGVPNSFQWCNLGSFLIRQVVIDVQGKSVSWLQKCRGQVRLQDFPCSLCVPQLPENSPQHYLIFMCLGFSDRMLNISYDYTLCIQISIWIPWRSAKMVCHSTAQLKSGVQQGEDPRGGGWPEILHRIPPDPRRSCGLQRRHWDLSDCWNGRWATWATQKNGTEVY